MIIAFEKYFSRVGIMGINYKKHTGKLPCAFGVKYMYSIREVNRQMHSASSENILLKYLFCPVSL